MTFTRPAPRNVDSTYVYFRTIVQYVEVSSLGCSANDNATLLQGCVGGHHHISFNENILPLARRLVTSLRYYCTSLSNNLNTHSSAPRQLHDWGCLQPTGTLTNRSETDFSGSRSDFTSQGTGPTSGCSVAHIRTW